jgi:hypothetical protein
VIGSFLIALLTSLQLWLGGLVPSVPGQQVRVAQAQPPSPTGHTNRTIARVVALDKDRRAAADRKDALAHRQQAQLAEIDRLKRRRASWRRDRQLETQLAESQQTASQLAGLDRRLRGLDRALQAAHRQVVAAVGAELRLAPPSSVRRRYLTGWAAASGRALQRTKKIILPDFEIDPLADPEDLELQAQRIAQSEKQLEQEILELSERAQRYDRMVKLREKAARATELSGMDDDRPRRSTGRVGSGAGAEADRGQGAGVSNDDASPAPPEDPSSFGGAESDPTVVLADVVDSGTLDALRRAESSGDPRARARATGRARSQVQAQLERLRKQRQLVERRAKQLRRE